MRGKMLMVERLILIALLLVTLLSMGGSYQLLHGLHLVQVNYSAKYAYKDLATSELNSIVNAVLAGESMVPKRVRPDVYMAQASYRVVFPLSNETDAERIIERIRSAADEAVAERKRQTECSGEASGGRQPSTGDSSAMPAEQSVAGANPETQGLQYVTVSNYSVAHPAAVKFWDLLVLLILVAALYANFRRTGR